MNKLDRTLRRRYHEWRNREGKFWRLPIDVYDEYLYAQYDPSALLLRREKTPILAFPPGCKGKDNTTASEWQRSQLPPMPNMSAYLLFKHLSGSEDPDVFLEPTPLPQQYTIGAGHYISIILERDRSITVYPTPAAFEELVEILKMKPLDASCCLFEDLCGNGWNMDFTPYHDTVVEDGVFYTNPEQGEGEFWAYYWNYEDQVYRCLHEDILLRGEAKMRYCYDPTYFDCNMLTIMGGKSLARKLAEACGLEVIVE